MSQQANIKTLDIVQESKKAIVEFGEEVRVALSMARSDMQHTIERLRGQVADHWKQQLRHWNKKLAEAKTDLYRAQVQMQDARQRPVEQARLVERAQRHVDEAEWKLQRIKHWVRELDREMLICKGQLQGLDQAVETDLPRATARLEQIMNALEAYISVQAPSMDDARLSEPGAKVSRLSKPEDAARRAAVPAFALSAEQRDAVKAAAGEIEFDDAAWSVAEADANRLAELDLPIDPPFPEDRVIISIEALESESLVLHRAESTAPGDSGWLIVPTGHNEPPDPVQCKAISFANFTSACKGLERLAVLPRGVTARLESGRVVELVNQDGRSRWQHAEGA